MPGQAIRHAEHASASLDEADIERYIAALATQAGFSEQRAPRVRALLSTTRAAEFVSVLNTELNSLVSLSSACSPDSDSIDQVLADADDQRQNLALETLFMRINLFEPTAVIYRELDDSILDAYIEFAQSKAGQTYHAALIAATRNTLVDRLQAFAHWRSEQALGQ